MIHVLPVARARARRFSIQFALGLVEGEFPQGERRPGLLSADRRRQANRLSGAALFPQPAGGEEASLFALALSRPWQLLYLSTRDAEEDGGLAYPSPYWSEARRLLGTPKPYRRRSLRELGHDAADAPTVHQYLRACAEHRLEPPDLALRTVLHSVPPWRRDPDVLHSQPALARLAKTTVFPATSLEDYARCPFGWFMKRVVQAAPLEQDLSGLEKGRFVHEALAAGYRDLQAEGLLPVTAASLPRAREIVASHVERLLAPSRDTGADGILLAWEVSRLARSALFLDATRGGPWLAKAVEYRLPQGGVDLGEGLCVSGRIDRIDGPPGQDSSFVLDYKSGSTAAGPSFAAEGALQVPLYILALRRLSPSGDVVGGAYAALGGDEVRGVVRAGVDDGLEAWLPRTCRLTEQELEDELAAALAAARQAANGMRSGRIAATPPGPCPSYCLFRPVCRTTNRVTQR